MRCWEMMLQLRTAWTIDVEGASQSRYYRPRENLQSYHLRFLRLRRVHVAPQSALDKRMFKSKARPQGKTHQHS